MNDTELQVSGETDVKIVDVELPIPDDFGRTADSPSGAPRSTPRLSGGKQQSFKLTGRITRYVNERSDRHEVSRAETVRAMLNERIDHEDMKEKIWKQIIREDMASNRI